MILQLKNVESAYGLSQILFGVNLEVREGEVCCLLGRNGVGKSTTIKTIMGQVKPKSGEILFEGQNIAGKHFYRPRDPKIAARYVEQFSKVNLFTIDDVFGGWQKAQKTHFDDGGVFDQIYQAGK